MKPEAVDHPKMVHLAALLKVPIAVANGVMERLWHWTGAHAPNGDIGVWPDESIEAAAGYPFEPSALVKALATARWIDAHPDSRWVIHDWHEHCPGYIFDRLRKRDQRNQARQARLAQLSQVVPGQSRDTNGTVPDVSQDSPGTPLGQSQDCHASRARVPVPRTPYPDPVPRISDPPSLDLPSEDLEKPAASRSRKPLSQQDGLVGELASAWADEHHGAEPTWGREVVGVHKLAKQHGEDEVRQAWRRYLAESDPFFAGHPIKHFVSQFDRFRFPAPPPKRKGWQPPNFANEDYTGPEFEERRRP